MKTVDYYMVSSSPWTYLGHDRLGEIAARTQAEIRIKPFDLGKVFPLSGGLPLPKRAPQRQAYRLVELARWRDYLSVPLTQQPKFFPVDHMPSLLLIAAARLASGEQAAFTLAGNVLRACWAQERDISDAETLDAVVSESGLEIAALQSLQADAQADIDTFTQEAIDAQVFGAPWYQVDGIPFWGQDRLEFVERALTGV